MKLQRYVKKGFEPSVRDSSWIVAFWIVGWIINQVAADGMAFAGP